MYKQAAYNLAIGLTLQELHQEQRMPREKIAEALDIPELAVTRVEHGSEVLTAGSLILLLDVFDVSWEEFLKRVKDNLPKAQSQIS